MPRLRHSGRAAVCRRTIRRGVERATGVRPAVPEALADLGARRERIIVLPNDLGAVRDFIRAQARRAEGTA